MFFEYSQNNSGGRFRFNPSNGITHHVVIEADSAREANDKAESIGIYFDGVSNGMDCDCCGDRWYPASPESGSVTPTVYGEPVELYKPLSKWINGPEVYVHYKNDQIGAFCVV